MANSPTYYRRGSIEVWDFIRDQGLSYHLGNAVKYICRAGHKGSKAEDLEKAIHYLSNELQHESCGTLPYGVQYPNGSCSTNHTEEFDR